MSGHAKRILYRITELLLMLATAAGIFFLTFFYYREADELSGAVAACILCLFVLLLPVATVILHEVGHLLFGFMAGLRFYSFSVRFFEVNRNGKLAFKNNPDFAGKTVMLPKNGRHVRAKLAVFALGGVVLNFIFGLVFLLLYFFAPLSPALLLFELLAPLSLFEGIIALYPVELSAGYSDGKILLELVKNTPYARVMQAVLTAQGQLIRGEYTDISRDMLFDLPVIREDDALFLSLTQLRLHFCFFLGEEAEAHKQLGRLKTLCEYTAEADAYSDVAWGMALLEGDAEGGLGFLRKNNVEPSPFIRYVLTGEGEAEARSEADGEESKGLKALKEKILAALQK